MKTVAVSCGDPNGIGLEILLKAHSEIIQSVIPIYCVHYELLQEASRLLKLPFPPTLKPIHCIPPTTTPTSIEPAQIKKESGAYSYESFILACELCDTHQAHALCTLPIHKKSWNLAHIDAKGHTQALSKRYQKESIMMLGWDKMFVALFSDHIPLNQVSNQIQEAKLLDFFLRLHSEVNAQKYCVMGLNPHCGDEGVMGKEDAIIAQTIQKANIALGNTSFKGPYPSDCAFIPKHQEEFKIWVAMYHDIGLATLKALYFEESINITLGIPILRTSVDHGVAFDIAYKNQASLKSYLNAITYITKKE